MKSLSALEFYALIYLLFGKAFGDGKKCDYASKLFGFGNYESSKQSLTYKIRDACNSRIPGPRYLYDRIQEYNLLILTDDQFTVGISHKHLKVLLRYLGLSDIDEVANTFFSVSGEERSTFQPQPIPFTEERDTTYTSSSELDRIYREVAGRIALAADVDRTLTLKSKDAQQEFTDEMAPVLLQTAKLGTPILIVTGNSMEALASRFLKWMLAYLWKTDNLAYLSNFHFFCNSGGAYAHFPDPVIPDADSSEPWESVLDRFIENRDDNLFIRPEFIDPTYIEMNKIDEEALIKIRKILAPICFAYQQKIDSERHRLQKLYRIPEDPSIAIKDRVIRYGQGQSATVQLTLKPVLSELMAHKPERVYGEDERTRLVAQIQEALNQNGLTRYTAKPGGTSSIDITLSTLTKETAIRYMINRLGIQGDPQQGELTGSRVLYLGDEVFLRGNDFSVTRIPGILVFAVNYDRNSIPFRSNVIAASKIFEGPQASQEVVQLFNQIARKEIALHKKALQNREPALPTRHAVALFKEQVFRQGIRQKVQILLDERKTNLTELHQAYILTTLLSREDPASARLVDTLVKFLDNMSHTLNLNATQDLQALAASHPEG